MRHNNKCRWGLRKQTYSVSYVRRVLTKLENELDEIYNRDIEEKEDHIIELLSLVDKIEEIAVFADGESHLITQKVYGDGRMIGNEESSTLPRKKMTQEELREGVLNTIRELK